MRAAAHAFAEHGFTGTSMEDVAAAAGITRLVVYRHFSTKEQLYVAVLEGVLDRLRDEVRSAFAHADGGRLGRAAVGAVMSVAREDPEAFTLLCRHAAREPRFVAHADAFRHLAVAFVESLLAGVDVGGAADRRWAAETLVTYVIGAVLHWLEEDDAAGDDAVVERVSASLPAIIGAWAGTKVPSPG